MAHRLPGCIEQRLCRPVINDPPPKALPAPRDIVSKTGSLFWITLPHCNLARAAVAAGLSLSRGSGETQVVKGFL